MKPRLALAAAIALLLVAAAVLFGRSSARAPGPGDPAPAAEPAPAAAPAAEGALALAADRFETDPVFSPVDSPSCSAPAEPPGSSLTVAVLGDTGSGSPVQHAVAGALARTCAEEGCDAALLLGDNFYPSGVASASDPAWRERFERPYGALGFPFVAALGNHDHRLRRSPASQVARSLQDPRWIMPSAAYRHCLAPWLDVVVLDTAPLIEDGAPGARWLDAQLAWMRALPRVPAGGSRLVVGHHPAWTHGAYSRTRQPDRVRAALAGPLREAGAALYLSGHDHDLQYVEAPAEPGLPPLRQVVSGAGGWTRPTCPPGIGDRPVPGGCEPPCLDRGTCDLPEHDSTLHYGRRGPGLALVRAGPGRLTVEFRAVDVATGAIERSPQFAVPIGEGPRLAETR